MYCTVYTVFVAVHRASCVCTCSVWVPSSPCVTSKRLASPTTKCGSARISYTHTHEHITDPSPRSKSHTSARARLPHCLLERPGPDELPGHIRLWLGLTTCEATSTLVRKMETARVRKQRVLYLRVSSILQDSNEDSTRCRNSLAYTRTACSIVYVKVTIVRIEYQSFTP